MKKILSLMFILLLIASPVYADDLSRPLKTGQTTSYETGDDGDLELGIEKSYTALNTGQYSGTTEITVTGKTHDTSNVCVRDDNTGLMWLQEVIQSDIGPQTDGKLFWEQWTLENKTDISFDNASGEIRSGASEFDTDALVAGRKITVTGTDSNDGTYTVSSILAGAITTVEGVADEAAGDTVTIATDGDLIWTALTAVNTAEVGGYSDWRIPNYLELTSIVNLEICNPAIDTTVFPSTPSTYHWTSSTYPCDAPYAFYVHFGYGYVSRYAKSANRHYLRFVRGGYGLVVAGNDNVIQNSLFNVAELKITGIGNSVYNTTHMRSLIKIAEDSTLSNVIGYNPNGTDITIASAKEVTGSYNLFDDAASAGDGTYTDTGTLWSSDPLFVSATDFNLKPGSPAINAGTDPFSNGDGDQYDLNGNLVWSDTTDSPVGYWEGGIEIGAYAFSPSGERRRKGLMRMGPRMRCNYCH